MIGEETLVGPSLISADRVRLTIRGRVKGGAQDGVPFEKRADLAIGEEVKPHPGVSITLKGIYPNGVRLGVIAPKTVSIHRQEVYEAIRRANEGRA